MQPAVSSTPEVALPESPVAEVVAVVAVAVVDAEVPVAVASVPLDPSSNTWPSCALQATMPRKPHIAHVVAERDRSAISLSVPCGRKTAHGVSRFRRACHPPVGHDRVTVLELIRPAHEPEEPISDFAALFRRYGPYVARIAARMLGREDDVEDLVQDVFVDAMRGVGRLADPAAVKGWLATVAVRKATRRLRRRKLLRLVGLDDPLDAVDAIDRAASPEQRLLLERVYRVLDEIPAVERVAWTLRRMEGERLERIAELCGCSLATAKRRVAAAEAKITERVDG
jgi:RNA polymerase sigma-70 factor (ECF subfamily)